MQQQAVGEALLVLHEEAVHAEPQSLQRHHRVAQLVVSVPEHSRNPLYSACPRVSTSAVHARTDVLALLHGEELVLEKRNDALS